LILRDDSIFWISIIAIAVLGTIGGVLFKHGTDNLGGVTFNRLIELRLTAPSIVSIGLVILGFILFFVGGYTLRDFSFAATYLFSPIIFSALVLLATSRFLVGIPLSMIGLGRFTAIATALGVATTAIASALIFREQFSIRALIGLGLAIGAVALLVEEF